ncbi:MAG: hypothetical protein QW346_01995 [Candidatus Micrarchaeaceae archaeon]
MNGKNAVGIDLDDTIADFTSAWLKVLEREKGIKLRERNIIQWEVENLLGGAVDRQDIENLFSKTWSEESENIKLLDRRIPKIIDRIRARAPVYIITAAKATDRRIREWLDVKQVKYDRLIHVRNHDEKLLKTVSIYVDDNPYAAKFALAGKYVIIFSKPWNATIRFTKQVIRAKSWGEVEQKVLQLIDTLQR